MGQHRGVAGRNDDDDNLIYSFIEEGCELIESLIGS